MLTQQRIKDIKEISIAIDTWDDIFSDFDPRPFDVRALSEDFIAELRKHYRETRTGHYLITIYGPAALKDEKRERAVIQRLKTHFKHRSLQRQRELARIRIRGFIFVFVGILFLGFLTLATYFKFVSDLAIELLGIVFMPLGWFGIWEGFSKIVDTSPIAMQEEALFKKLSLASYRFRHIEK
jgi:hypothetical protein